VEKSSARLKVFALLVMLMFAALTTRLWFLQVLAADQFRKEANDNSVRLVKSDALRGDIKTADHVTLVDNVLSLEVRVDKQELEASGQTESVLLRLSDLLEIKVQTLRERLDDARYFDYQPKPVAEFVPKEAYWYIREHPEEFPGVQVLQTSVRGYPQRRLASHVVGYLGLIEASQYDDPAFNPNHSRYGQSDMVGKAGLEKVYEKYLRGSEGEQKFIVNSNGDTIRTLGAIPPTPGDNLILTINSKIQGYAQTELRKGILAARGQIDAAGGQNKLLKADAGAAVVMDVKTGGVVAMASWPNYDPSWFVKGLTPHQNHYLFHSPLAPSVDRAIQLTYKPGSSFKPIVALASVKEGVASLSGSYSCPAVYTAPNDTSGASFTNWSPVDIGYMSIAESLRISCDTVYYQFGDDFWNRWRQEAFGTNNEPFQRDLHQWGFGSNTNVDLPGEQAGVIPDNQFALDHPDIYPYGWVPGGDILLSIGSGDTLVTPLQLATAYSAIANGGKLCRPHLVDHIQDASNHLVKTINDNCKQLPYTPAQLQYIRDALATVPSSGTAHTAFSGFPLGTFPIAGKTGTAERPPFQSTSWFASFSPVNNAKYVVVVMVEEGGYGSQTAAPIARHIYEDIDGVTSSGIVNGGAGD
jgi:penicillin-binding protein 2